MKVFNKGVIVTLLIGIIIIFAILTAYCQPKYAFDAATVDKLHNTGGIWLQNFAATVRYATGGDIDINIYPGGEWGGGEEQYLQGVQLGSLDIAVIAMSPVSQYTDALFLFDTPFLFKDAIHAMSTMYSSSNSLTELAAARLEQASKDARFHIMGIALTGDRNIGASKPINTIDDIKGLKIRTMSSPVQVDTFNALGAIATPLPFGEVFTALQLKNIDGIENPTNNYVEMNFYEVAPYWLVTKHYNVPQCIAISNKAWDSLPAAYQSIVKEAAIATGYTRSAWAIGVDQYLLEVRAKEVAKEVKYLSTEEQKEMREMVLPRLLDVYGKKIGMDVLEMLAKTDDVINNWLKK